MRRVLAVLVTALSLSACSEKKAEVEAPPPVPVEIVPAKTVIEVPEFVIGTTPDDIKKGEGFFASKGCIACHKIGGGKLVGPDLKGVTARREANWIKRMILRPDVMVKEDDVARKLLAETMVPMPNQGVDPKSELPFILAFLKNAEK